MSRGSYLLKRGLQGVFVIWGVVTVVFLLRFITPGDAIAFVVPIDASSELRQQIATELGLNQPVYVQYAEYVWGLLHGDMGYSYISGTEASIRVFNRLPATLELTFTASIVAVVLAIPLGVLSATHRQQPIDYGATFASLIGISAPNFWLGIMLVLLFAVQLGLFPTSTRPIGFLPAMNQLLVNQSLSGLTTWLSYMALPALTLGTYFTALITRLTRSGMLDELGEGYVQSARAKGLPNSIIHYNHVLRNTLIPVITVLGLQIGSLIGGAVIVEAVFDWPGLGSLLVNAIYARDWPLIQGTLIVIGIGFVTINTITDLLYSYLDPEVTY